MAIAGVGLIGVVLLIANYVSTVGKQVGPKINILMLTQPVAAYSPIPQSALREVSVPVKWAPSNALRDPSQTGTLVAGVALPPGTELQQGMLIAPPALSGDLREVAVLVDAETGVAGQLTAGSHVDVIADYAGDTSRGIRPSTKVVVSQVTVSGIGTPTTAGSSPPPTVPSGSHAVTQSQGLPVTLLLTPGQVLKVSYAESFAQKVRLSLVPPGTFGQPPRLRPYQPAP